MNINFNDIITNNEDEKKLINYISKSDNKKIEESMLIIEKYTGYKLNDFINDLENIDIGLMLFIGLLEALSGQNIFKIYSKAFQAIISKQYNNVYIRNKIMEDVSNKFNISLDFLLDILKLFNNYVHNDKTDSNTDEEDNFDFAKLMDIPLHKDNSDSSSTDMNDNSSTDMDDRRLTYMDNSSSIDMDNSSSNGIYNGKPNNMYNNGLTNIPAYNYNNSYNSTYNNNFYDRDLYSKHKAITKKQRKVYIPVALASIIIVILLSVTFLSPYGLNISVFNEQSHALLEVKGLTLKYVLVAVAGEMYDINVLIDGDQSEFYREYGKDSYHHYLWIRDTYRKLPSDKKRHLKTIYSSGFYEGTLIYLLADLEDEAGVNQIVYEIKRSKYIPENIKIAAEEFYPYFYEEHLKEYISINRITYDNYAMEMNKMIQEEKPNILEFIEETSGVKYDKKYKPVIYYTMRPGNALGFIYKDSYISLIPGTENNYDNLFYIPYHEFSHGIFNKITTTKEFRQAADVLKDDKRMYNSWNNGFYNIYYDWYDWCEESLVEGFTMYLEYKSKGKLSNSITSIRPYDKQFFEYLVDINFDPETMDLKDVSVRFLKSLDK